MHIFLYLSKPHSFYCVYAMHLQPVVYTHIYINTESSSQQAECAEATDEQRGNLDGKAEG